MNTIPIKATPNQRLKCVLGGQYCTIRLYTLSTGLYLDLLVNNAPIIQGQLCINDVILIREEYLGFIGDLIFNDTQGASDPDYTGLGSRYRLLYLTPAEVAAHESVLSEVALDFSTAHIPDPPPITIGQIGTTFIVGYSSIY
jgi:hypothetical protein